MFVLPLASIGQHDRGVGLETGGIAVAMLRPANVLSAIHATSALVPMRHVPPSLALMTIPPG
jgi:hypothetical protein